MARKLLNLPNRVRMPVLNIDPEAQVSVVMSSLLLNGYRRPKFEALATKSGLKKENQVELDVWDE